MQVNIIQNGLPRKQPQLITASVQVRGVGENSKRSCWRGETQLDGENSEECSQRVFLWLLSCRTPSVVQEVRAAAFQMDNVTYKQCSQICYYHYQSLNPRSLTKTEEKNARKLVIRVISFLITAVAASSKQLSKKSHWQWEHDGVVVLRRDGGEGL